MGKYDDITPEQLRGELERFARLILALEEKGVLLEKSPTLLRILGELRQMLFAYEVRGTRRLTADDASDGAPGSAQAAADPAAEESLRIVREAVERERRFLEELGLEGEEPEES